MKTTKELIELFSKGNDDFFNVSDKQVNWLRSQAQRENLLTYGDEIITIGLNAYWIKKNYSPVSAVGGYVGRRSCPGSHVVKYHYIKTPNGHIEMVCYNNLQCRKREGCIVIPKPTDKNGYLATG
jgi:hypothetical protein